MTNIRGKLGTKESFVKKIPFDEEPKDLKECFNCKGCLCEDLCKEYEDEYFGKKEGE